MKNETFGARLLHRRKKLKLSQAALGKLVKVAHVTISQWERDETQPAGKRLFALSQALQCSPTWLLFGDEDKQPGEPIPDNQPAILFSTPCNKKHKLSNTCVFYIKKT